MPDHYCDKCGEVDYECICDQEYARIHQLEAEIERLRTLIRCEQIEPPADATDDQTTELAVDLAEAKAEIDRLRAENDNWNTEHAAICELLNISPEDEDIYLFVDEMLAEVKRLKIELQRWRNMACEGTPMHFDRDGNMGIGLHKEAGGE